MRTGMTSSSVDLEAIEAILFDLDGTLVETDNRWARLMGRRLAFLRRLNPRLDADRLGRDLVMAIETPSNYVVSVAERLGIARVEADVLPERKVEIVARLKTEGRMVAMAGDGINDAPALARADVGLAMSTGTDVAIESAGITLLGGDLEGIARARRLSRATMRNIRQNLFFAFVYNSLGIPVAAGVLYPFFGLLLSPIIAAAAMTLSSLSVITNALRLRRVKLY